MENSFTVGYVSEATRRNLSTGAVAAEARNPAWNGLFFVYDRTGKEALLSKAILRLRAGEKETPRLSPLIIGGVPVLKSEGKNGVTYWAEHGKYAVGAGERSVMEEILNRLDGKVSGAMEKFPERHLWRNPLRIRKREKTLEAACWNFFCAFPS